MDLPVDDFLVNAICFKTFLFLGLPMINPFEQIFCSQLNYTRFLIISSYRESLAGTCLTVCKYCCIVSFESIMKDIVEIFVENLFSCICLTEHTIEKV